MTGVKQTNIKHSTHDGQMANSIYSMTLDDYVSPHEPSSKGTIFTL